MLAQFGEQVKQQSAASLAEGKYPSSQVRAHDGKAGVDSSALSLFDLVHSGFHVVVDATRLAAPLSAANERVWASNSIP